MKAAKDFINLLGTVFVVGVAGIGIGYVVTSVLGL
jgi:hypothetical protein